MQIQPGDCVLGVDGGGTWTRSVVMRLDGTLIGRGHGGPSNPVTIGVEQALRNIIQAVDEATQTSGVNSFKASILGLAGAARSQLGVELLERLPGRYGEARIVSDAQSALAGATGCKPGVVVIAGTGSIAYGVNEAGEEVKVGGWGWRLGDEGSGYTIGKNAITEALRGHDQTGPETMLKEMIMDYLGFTDPEQFIDWSYDPKREPRHFAALVPFVKEAELRNDTVASGIMREAGAQLGKITQTVIRRLKLKGGFPVACCGGVFKQPNGYNVAFENTVREAAPLCVFIEPLFTSTVGSALIALKSLEVDIDDDLLSVVERSWRNLDE
jgi:N-acetylglucosamine kinase-like BadF-type ATPase